MSNAAATAKKRALFLTTYAVVGNISIAASKAGIDRVTHYRWLEDAEYSEAFTQAREQAVDSLEAEARRRAAEGVKEAIYHQGKVVGHVKKYSDTLLIFLLKGARPDVYRERHEITGAGGGPLLISRGMTDDGEK